MHLHTVRPGESIVQLAEAYGHYVTTIWNHDDNRDLRAERPNMNALVPGDRVTIPDVALKSADAVTDQRHRFRRRGVPAMLRFRLIVDGEIRADQTCRVDVDGRLTETRSDGDGVVALFVPPGARAARVFIGEGPDVVRCDLQLGHLRSITDIAGVQDRLQNLGYLQGQTPGDLDGPTRDGLADFQRDYGITVTGEPGDETRAALEAAHDGRGRRPA